MATPQFDNRSEVARVLGAFTAGSPIDELVDDAVLEFPFGPTLGVPSLVEGPGAARQHLDAVRSSGLVLGEPQVTSVGDAGQCLVEHVGTYQVNGQAVPVGIVSLITLREGRIAHLREFWDTGALLRAHGQ